MIRFHWQTIEDDPRFGPVYRRVTTQPSWVWGTAILLGALVFIIPLLLLAGAAVLTILIVWAVLGFVHRITRGVSGLFGGSPEGRRNVRVVRRDQAR